ncbi:MAG: hypothetical protein HQK53_08495 [Oligoflexia bacterium]|nr:hypothetical protein [Oligoflexia bacterium]
MIRRNEAEAFKGFIRYLTDLKMMIRMIIYFILIILTLQLLYNVINFIFLKSVYTNSKLLYFESLVAFVVAKIPFFKGVKFFSVGAYDCSAIQFTYIYSKLITYGYCFRASTPSFGSSREMF